MKSPLRILMVEDLPSDVELVRHEISRAGIVFDSLVVDKRDAYLEALRAYQPDIVLSDYSMPCFDGMSALRLLKEHAPGIPFIMVTGSMNETTAVECMKAGANDYLIKENLRRIGPAIEAAIEKNALAAEKARNEAELLASESKYRRLHESMRDAFVSVDMEGRIREYNTAYLDMLGYAPEEIERLTYRDLTPAQWQAFEDDIVARQILPRGYSDIYEKEYIRKDGTVFPVELRVYLLRDDAGAPSGMWAIVRDISERKQAEETLRSNEVRFHTVADFTYDWEMWIDPAGAVVYCSPSCERISGYGPDEFAADPQLLVRIIHPDDRAGFIRHLKDDETIENDAKSIDYRIITRAGEQRWINHYCLPIIDRGSRAYLGRRISNRDITERKQALDALRQSKEYNEKIVAAVNVGLSVLDVEGRHVMVNPALCSVTGFSPEELLNCGIPHPYWPEEEMETIRGEIRKVVNGVLKDSRLVFQRKNGERFPVLVSPAIVKDEHGRVLNYIATIKDLSELTQMEYQLQQMQKMEALGQLTGGIAHDFNNMLTPILGYAEMLLADMPEDDPRRRDLHQIKQAAEKARELTAQLLAFSRKQILEMKKIDLAEVIVDFQKILRRTIRENITIRCELASKRTMIVADPGKIEQILMNLAVNAQDAMPGGGAITIETSEAVMDEAFIELHPGSRPGRYTLLTFSDTGSGMGKETLAHVFEPFFTTKPPGKGTGLGLSTVFGIVKQHNGYITVYSEPGVGTTVKIYLPIAAAHAAAGEEARTDETVRPGTETILVVENEEAVRVLTCRILSTYGYRVISAGGAEECFQAVAHFQGTPHLLLTDVIMPGLNGKQLHERLAADMPGLKVLFMSGYPYEVITEHGLLIEGTNFIFKPFTARDLAKKVRSVLDA